MLSDAERIELAIRRVAADPHAPPWLPHWFGKLADEIARSVKRDHQITEEGALLKQAEALQARADTLLKIADCYPTHKPEAD